MRVRRATIARQDHDEAAEEDARAAADAAKQALSKRGLVNWNDGATDVNRYMARNTPYADWYADLI